MKALEPRDYESNSHRYEMTFGPHGHDTPRRHQRVQLVVTNKKSSRGTTIYMPVDDSGIVGDLLSGFHLEREGYLRMEVMPDLLEEGDVIEGVGAITEIELIEMTELVMIKVAIPEAGASVLYTRMASQPEWPATVGITRPIEGPDFE